MQVTSLDYSSFVGRIAIGRVSRGTIKENQPVSLVKADGKIEKGRVKELHLFEGVGRKKVSEVSAGDIRSEEHTSELQSRFDLVCRLMLQKKKKNREATK